MVNGARPSDGVGGWIPRDKKTKQFTQGQAIGCSVGGTGLTQLNKDKGQKPKVVDGIGGKFFG